MDDWLLQGSHFPVFRRYNSTLKIKNLPIIVLSNYDIDHAYGNVHFNTPWRLDSLKSRFLQVKVTKFIKLPI